MILAAYLLIVNLVAFFMYKLDKSKAKRGQWRIKEKTLIIIAYIGGGLGAHLGMILLRHKTKHISFRILIPLGLLFNIVTVAGIVWLLLRH